MTTNPISSVNATIRIRAISKASLDAVLELLGDSSKGVLVLEQFDSTELPG